MSIWKGKHGPLLIAEIGGNHEGDFNYAKKLTKLAIEADVDFIKFQLYSGDTLVNPLVNPTRNRHFKKFELSRQQYIELAQMCEDAGKKFLASVWDINYVDWIDQYCDFYKIGSGDLTAYNIIKGFVETGKPILLSSGLSYIHEVSNTIDFIRKTSSVYSNPNQLALLQCTSMYPIPFKDANLNVMHSFKEAFNIPIGYSDHTEGSYALEIAVAMGAEILEFHFTDNREGKTFRDHFVSLNKDEVLILIDKINQIKALQGNTIKTPLEIEGDHLRTFRRAVYLNKDLKAGDLVKDEDLVALRPNEGISATEYYDLINKRLNADTNQHQPLKKENFQN